MLLNNLPVKELDDGLQSEDDVLRCFKKTDEVQAFAAEIKQNLELHDWKAAGWSLIETMSAMNEVETLCKGLDMGDVLNFYAHHLNEDGKICVQSLDSIKDDLWTLFVKYDITVEELVDEVKILYHKMGPIVEHCPKIGIDY